MTATTKMDRPLYRRLMHVLWKTLRDDQHWTRSGATAVVFAGLEVASIFSAEVLQWDRADLLRACGEVHEIVNRHLARRAPTANPGAN